MTPVVPFSNTCYFGSLGNAFVTRKDCSQRNCSIFWRFRKQKVVSQRYSVPLCTTTLSFFPFRTEYALLAKSRTHIVTAIGTDVAVVEANSAADDKESGERVGSLPVPPEASEDSSIKSDASPALSRSKRPRAIRKSDMPPVNNEDLIPGTTFAGKVKSIQPFGAFVDFGAFTDGLVHVSQLSDSFVKDVKDIVSIGQEVTVRLVEANTETGRISLTMRSSDETSKVEQQKQVNSGSDKSRSPRKSSPQSNQKRNEARKSSKFVKGQELEGTVKNLTRSGAFVSLPEGEEGFLPTSEEAAEGFGNMMGGTSLQVGQEVKVRVLRFNRGQVTLTMKDEDDAAGSDSLIRSAVVHTATNPFVLAFRKNKDISVFLDKQQKEKELTSEVVVDAQVENNAIDSRHEGQEGILSDASQGVDSAVDRTGDEQEASSQLLAAEASSSVLDGETEVTPVTDEAETVAEPDLSREVSSFSSESLIGEEVTQTVIADVAVEDIAQCQTPVEVVQDDSPVKSEVEPVQESNGNVGGSSEQVEFASNAESIIKEGELAAVVENQNDSATVPDETQFESPTEESRSASTIVENQSDSADVVDETQVGSFIEESESATAGIVKEQSESNDNDSSSNERDGASLTKETTIEESKVSDIAGSQIGTTVIDGVQAEASGENENSSTSSNDKVGPALVEMFGVADPSLQNEAISSAKEATTRASISPALVKQLREETGAGMMDCKKALSETGGDIIKAQEYLRKKGLASADKKASRATAEGRIGAYIHDSRIGVLIEVNCETDFVARGDIFKELVDDLAMQVAACPQVQHIDTDDIPHGIVDKEREIEMQKEDLLSKPEQIRSKIVDGRIRKRLEELALLEQPYIKNDKTVVKDLVKQTIATIGENIKVKRFARYNLGEGLEKKSQDFAAEVAAQTAAKAPAPVKEQSSVGEVTETVDKPIKATISAALVKQLREETGAGMMDCKKALSETGGDLEKAQEYLRKKGLSAADKKSSRLAAEGRIGSYIHDSRIGVLIEVNCETDFVGRSEKFKELVDDLAMQVVACPQVEYVSVEDIPADIVNREKELEMQREDLQSKPENIREKIVDGRISKRLGELALLEQAFIKDDSLLVKDMVKQSVAAIGENIKVRRFVRFTLGEETDTNKGGE